MLYYVNPTETRAAIAPLRFLPSLCTNEEARNRRSSSKWQPVHPRLIIHSSPTHHSASFHISKDHIPASPSRNRTNKNFSSAALRLIRRCDQISRRYFARIYIQMSRQHKYYEYKSTNEESFPMPIDNLIRSLAAPPSTPALVPRSWLK